MKTFRRSLALCATLLLAAACELEQSTGIIITDPPMYDARSIVAAFTHLADSVAETPGADADLGNAYRSLAQAVQQGGRVGAVTIVIDGVPTVFLATAQQTELANSPCGATPGCLALGASIVQRSFLAWQQDNPKRIVQLTSKTDRDSVYAQIHPSFAAPGFPTALLVFMDGAGGTFFGTSGTQQIAITTSTAACPVLGADLILHTPGYTPPVCTNATFDVRFAAKAEPSSFLVGRNTATGSHTLSMTAPLVPGPRLQFSAGLPPTPPITITPAVTLPAVATATVNSVVTLTLTVTNTANTPAVVSFSSGQHYDFQIFDAATGANVYTWSADKLFAALFGTESIGPNMAVTYAITWRPTMNGSFVAQGTLVSQSHRATATAAFVVK
jgi:hypothetical protein